jgi:GNAT superfamily N-acetyltransferase
MHLRLICLAFVMTGCTGEIAGGVEQPDAFDELDRIQRDGPPRYTSRVHGCVKMRYRTLGNVLVSRGVDLTATGALSAGNLYVRGVQALGAPSYTARVRENIDLGVATTAKMFDVYAQAAPEIIARLASRPECQLQGVGAALFDAADRCVADGVSCLIGVPATAAHLEICNQTVAAAVAALAAAAHLCE